MTNAGSWSSRSADCRFCWSRGRPRAGGVNDVSLVEAALAPGEAGYVAVDRIGDLELPGRPLDSYRAVVLAGVGGIDDATAEQVAAFVRGGGALLLFLGEATTADNYNGRLLPRGLLPGPLVRRVSAGGEELFRLDLDPRQVHPYLAAFAGAGETGIDRPAVRQYWEIEPRDGVGRVADYANDDPAVLTHDLGAGRVVTVTTAAADAEWTLLPLTPAYPAFVHELLRGAVGDSGGGTSWQTVEVGDALRLPATFAVPAGVTPTLVGDGPARPFRREVRPDGAGVWTLDAPADPGTYEVRAGDSTAPVAVNFPAAESDVTRADDAAIRAAFGDGATIRDLAAAGDGGAVLDEDAGLDWGWPLLFAVLLLAAAEAAFASHVGRRRG